MPESARKAIVEIPWRTILKIVAAVTLVWVWLQIAQVILVLVVAVILAVTLNPVVEWLARRGVSRSPASVLVSLTLLGIVVAFLWVTWSSLNNQAQYAAHQFSDLEQRVVNMIPEWMRPVPATEDRSVGSLMAPYAVRVARSAAAALLVTVLGFVLTVYLLIEGPRTRDWLLAFVPLRHRGKMERTLREGEVVVLGYMAGNVITSVLAFAFVLTLLTILKVPAALLLALLAGLFDFVPVVGFICSAFPAVVLAATVSDTAALLVAALYTAYHGIENYIISPWAYGDRLKLSNVAVVVGFAIGAEVAGVIGALIALPVAAVYPVVEQIWLRDRLPADTVREHRKAG